jgi:hypothetical protein
MKIRFNKNENGTYLDVDVTCKDKDLKDSLPRLERALAELIHGLERHGSSTTVDNTGR